MRTNGRRDVCGAEQGGPIASAIAARWPEATWETTHLGGHRCAGTLLALPSGVTLGRLDVTAVVDDFTALTHGRFPVEHTRGRAGCPPRTQVAELYLRAELGIDGLDATRTVPVEDDLVRMYGAGEELAVTVQDSVAEPRRQSCAGLKTTSAGAYEVTSWVKERPASRTSPAPRDGATR